MSNTHTLMNTYINPSTDDLKPARNHMQRTFSNYVQFTQYVRSLDAHWLFMMTPAMHQHMHEKKTWNIKRKNQYIIVSRLKQYQYIV